MSKLITLQKNNVKSAVGFVASALEKILSHRTYYFKLKFIIIIDLPSKYWLRGLLTGDNVLRDGFYDVGPAPASHEDVHGFPLLADLLTAPVDKKREVLLVHRAQDAALQDLIDRVTKRVQTELRNTSAGATAAASVMSAAHTFPSRVFVLQIIAKEVADAMGGPKPANQDETDVTYKFHLTSRSVC